MKNKYSVAMVKSINEDGSVKFRLTEKKVDRHGEVVYPDGVNLNNYIKNPIVLYSHGYSKNGMMPVGKIDVNSIKQTKDYIDANVIFDESTGDEFAIMVAEKVRQGFLNAGSIGFRSSVRSDENKLSGQTGVSHIKSELFEFSIVPVPALASAVARREFSEFMQKAGEKFGEITNDEEKNKFDELQKDIEFFKTHTEEKAGRVLSKKNRTLLKNALNALGEIQSVFNDLLEATEPEDDSKDTDSKNKNKDKVFDSDVAELVDQINYLLLEIGVRKHFNVH